MMVVDVNIHFCFSCQALESAYTARLSRIHQDEALNLCKVQIFNFGKIEKVEGGLNQEFSKIMLLGSGKYHHRLWVELLCGNH